MNDYTVVILHEWSKYGDDVKNIFHNHNLKWNSTKTINLKNEDLINVFNKFQLTKLDFVINGNNAASSGVWENDDFSVAIKIIKIANNDDVILIYKGVAKEFYTEFLKKCKDISSLIRKIVDDKTTFEKRLNIDLFKNLSNVNEIKKNKIKNFEIRIGITGGFSDEFKNKWIKCIENS